ncbi:hypothetical protein ACJX0J_026094, partial [Zea mays]
MPTAKQYVNVGGKTAQLFTLGPIWMHMINFYMHTIYACMWGTCIFVSCFHWDDIFKEKDMLSSCTRLPD